MKSARRILRVFAVYMVICAHLCQGQDFLDTMFDTILSGDDETADILSFLSFMEPEYRHTDVAMLPTATGTRLEQIVTKTGNQLGQSSMWSGNQLDQILAETGNQLGQSSMLSGNKLEQILTKTGNQLGQSLTMSGNQLEHILTNTGNQLDQSGMTNGNQLQPIITAATGGQQLLTGTKPNILAEICSEMSTQSGWGLHPFPGSCYQYLQCDRSGRAFMKTCAVGTFFDGRKCLKAEDVSCAWDPCRTNPGGHRYTDGQRCYGYYSCVNGRSVSGICPAMFAFNSLKHRCLPDHTCQQPSALLHPCASGTTMAFPGQPHMFYLWDGQDGVTPMECPPGLRYNPQICACDWVIPGLINGAASTCTSMFHFGYNGDFLEEYNRAPQSVSTGVSIYQNSALFTGGGRIVIWMMNDIDMDSEWALCFEFMTQDYKGEVALVSNDWNQHSFTFKVTYIPSRNRVKGYFRMKDGNVVELLIMGVEPNVPHFLRVAKQGSVMTMRVDNMPPATVTIDAGVSSTSSPMVVGQAEGCAGFEGFFDELKFFRCVPQGFFTDYKEKLYLN